MSLSILTLFHYSRIKGSHCGVWYYLEHALTAMLILFCILIIGKKCYQYRRKDEDVHNKCLLKSSMRNVGPEAERKSVCKERRKKSRQRKHKRGKKDKGL